MPDVNATIVPDGLDHDWEDALHTIVEFELPPQKEYLPGHNRLADAVDWFIDAPGDDATDEELPRLPVATTDEVSGPISISLDDQPALVGEPPARRPVALLGAVGLVVLAAAAAALAAAMGVVAVGAGAATVWLATPTAGPVVEPPAIEAVAPVVDEQVEAAPAEPEPEPVPVAEAPTAEKAPAKAPAAAPEEPPVRRPRPPIVAPVADGQADEVAPQTVKLITQPPAARIVVDGVDHGRTPLKLELAPGTHSVLLEQGDVQSTVDVTVDASGEQRLCFTASEGAFATSGCP